MQSVSWPGRHQKGNRVQPRNAQPFHTHTRSRRARAILPSKNPLDIPTAGEHKEERSQQKGNKHRAARSGEIKTLPPTLKKGLRDLVQARVGRSGKVGAAGLCFSYAGPRDAGAARNRDRENARIRLVCKRSSPPAPVPCPILLPLLPCAAVWRFVSANVFAPFNT